MKWRGRKASADEKEEGRGKHSEGEEARRAEKKGESEIKSVKEETGEESRKTERRQREERQSRKSHAETEKSGSSLRSPKYMWVQCNTKIFCCCTTRQRFTPMRKAVVTSSQLTESLSGGDKGLESSW